MSLIENGGEDIEEHKDKTNFSDMDSEDLDNYMEELEAQNEFSDSESDVDS